MAEFMIKSADELSKMDAEGLAGYYTELNTHKANEMNALIEAKASKEDIESLRTELSESRDQQMKQLNAVLETQGLAIKRLSAVEKEERAKNMYDGVKEALSHNAEKLSNLKAEDKSTASTSGFSFKAAGTMLISTNVSGGNVPVEQREAGLNRIARRNPFILDLVNRGTAVSNVISWVEQQNPDGGAGGTDEGAAKNQADFDLVVVSESVVKRTVFIKVSTEMLDDIDFMASEINNELIQLLLLDVDSQVLGGNGTAPNLQGIIGQATAFAGGTFAGTVDNANLVDVLTVAMNQIMIANHEANNIVLHPSDVTALKLIKVSTTDKRYIDRLVDVAGGLSLDGVRIVQNTGITAGTYLVGDFTKSTVFDKGALSIDVGMSGDDFVQNLRTILAEWRGLQRIKGNDTTAFVTGTIATDAAVLETP